MIELRRIFESQHSVIGLQQVRNLGFGRDFASQRVARGEWLQIHRGVYRLAGVATTHWQDLMAACLGGGPRAQASHRSAAWMWELVPRPPSLPEISVPANVHPRLDRVVIHRPNDLDPRRTLVRNGVPGGDPLRSLFDLAGVADLRTLSQALDNGLSRRLFDQAAIEAEILRRATRGRNGSAAMKRILAERGFGGGPEMSALEAQAMRLFERWGIAIISRETAVYPDGRYRIDFFVCPEVTVEVDGFAYHWSPEAKRHDEERRNRLRLDGLFLLVYTWKDILYDERRVAGEIMHAVRHHAH